MPKKSNAPHVGASEAKAMFEYYMETENMLEVSRKFERSYPTVRKVARLNNWKDLKNKVGEERRIQLTKQVVKSEIDDMKLVDAILARVLELLIGDGTKEKPGCLVDPKVADAVALMRLRQELLKNLTPDKPEGSTTNNVFNIDVRRLPDDEHDNLKRNIAKAFGRF